MDLYEMTKARKIERKILELARDENVDSGVLILALADVLGHVAALCDRVVGVQPIDLRLQTVMDRARVAYGRATMGLNV